MPADLMSTMLMIGLMGLAFWLLLIRPAQRKQKAQQAMVSALGPGTRVMTTAGVLATVRELGERTAVIEISPGVEMTILKQAIMRTVEASEEEFEYDDDALAGDPVESFDELDAPIEGEVFDPERPIDPDNNRSV